MHCWWHWGGQGRAGLGEQSVSPQPGSAWLTGAAEEESTAVTHCSPTQPFSSGNKASLGAGLLHVGIGLIKREALTRCRGIVCLLKSCGPKHLIIMGFGAAVGLLD